MTLREGYSKQEGVGNSTRGCRETPDKRLPIGLPSTEGHPWSSDGDRIADSWGFKTEA